MSSGNEKMSGRFQLYIMGIKIITQMTKIKPSDMHFFRKFKTTPKHWITVSLGITVKHEENVGIFFVLHK